MDDKDQRIAHLEAENARLNKAWLTKSKRQAEADKESALWFEQAQNAKIANAELEERVRTLEADLAREQNVVVQLRARTPMDAIRFGALMRCGRIKPQGSAGVNPTTGERTYADRPGSVHFGAEFWVEPEAELSNMTIWGRHCLSALADDILAFEAAGRQFTDHG